jgi:hypothetical protein
MAKHGCTVPLTAMRLDSALATVVAMIVAMVVAMMMAVIPVWGYNNATRQQNGGHHSQRNKQLHVDISCLSN